MFVFYCMETTLDLPMSERKALSITNTFRQFGKRLSGFVRGRVDSAEDAEDILQDVWYQLSIVDDISALENVGSWLYRVARNRITDRSRKQQLPAIEDYAYEDEEGGFSFKELLLMDDENNPEMAFFKEMFWTEFQIALDELPANQREVFVLNEMEDVPLREIAGRTGENLKTIISRKGYAVKHLKNKLNFLYNELNM